MVDESFSQRLTLALDASDLSLSRISDRLHEMGTPCSITTLTSWRLGHTLPERESSLHAVANLERLLGAPAGFLAAGTDRAAPGSDAWWRTALRQAQPARRGSAEAVGRSTWESDDSQAHRRHQLAVVSVFLDDDGVVEMVQRVDVVAAAGGPVRTHVIADAQVPRTEQPSFQAVRVLTGGVVDAARPLEGDAGTAYRITLDRPLADGETVLVETRLLLAGQTGEPSRSGRYELPVPVPCGQLLLEVRFPAAGRPDWISVSRRGAEGVGAGAQSVALPAATASASLGAVPGGVVVAEWGVTPA